MANPTTEPLYKTIFQEKISENPLKYSVYEDVLVGVSPTDVDDQINQYEEIIADNSINISDQNDIRIAWVKGIPLISMKYQPTQTRYQFVEGILRKLDLCVSGWNVGSPITESRIKEIYDLMTSDCPIDQIIEKFTTEELRTYGW